MSTTELLNILEKWSFSRFVFPCLLNFVGFHYPGNAITLSGEGSPWPAPVLWSVNSMELSSTTTTFWFLTPGLVLKGWLLHSLLTHHLCKYTDTHRALQGYGIVKAVKGIVKDSSTWTLRIMLDKHSSTENTEKIKFEVRGTDQKKTICTRV